MSRPPYGPRGPRGRGRRLSGPLRGVTVVTFVVSVGGLALPGRAGETAGGALVALLVAVPISRVAFLGVRWWQIGDRRFAAAAGLLLVVLAAAVAVAWTV